MAPSGELACVHAFRRHQSLGEHRSWNRDSIQPGMDVSQDSLFQRRISPQRNPPLRYVRACNLFQPLTRQLLIAIECNGSRRRLFRLCEIFELLQHDDFHQVTVWIRNDPNRRTSANRLKCAFPSIERTDGILTMWLQKLRPSVALAVRGQS
jgi:hypothetical protein